MSNIVIFGATGGMGYALAEKCLDAGNKVFLSSLSKSKLFTVAEKLKSPFKAADIRSADEVKSVFDAAEEQMGEIDGVSVCVGSLFLKPAHLTSEEEFSDVLDLNLMGSFRVLRCAVKKMTSRGGSIVLVSSVAAKYGLANHEAVASAKSGVEGLVRSAAASYATKKIRVNAVAPGMVETPLTEHLLARDIAKKMSADMHPLGRIGQPHDIADAIAWLLSKESAWVTGQVISVDGGMNNIKPRLI